MFYSRHFHCARVTISADRGWRLRAHDSSVRKARTEAVTGSEGQEGANGVEGGIEVGGGNGDGNGVGGGNGDGDGDGSESSSGDGNGDEDNGNGNEDRIGEGGRKAKKRKKLQNSCRRHVGHGGDFGGNIKI